MDALRPPASTPEVLAFRSVNTPSFAPPSSARLAEHRRQKRLPVALDVSVETDSNFYMGLTENISEGGIFVATVHIKPIGAPVELHVTLDDGFPPLHLTGEVRWTRDCPPQGMGIRFERLGDIERMRIRSFLNRRDPLFFEE